MSTFNAPVVHGTTLDLITPFAPIPSATTLRFALDPLLWIGVPAGTIISAFASGAVERATGPSNGIPGDAASPWTAFQLSPLPQLAPSAFKAIPGGLPVMIVLAVGTVGPPPSADDFLVGGSPFVTAPAGSGSTAFLGFAFQDRICRDPLSAAEAIALSGACAADWAQFIADIGALPGARNVRVVDHRGAPLSSGTVRVSIDGAWTPVPISMSDGDTGMSVGAASTASVALASGAHPIVAAVDADTGAFEGTGLTLAAGKRLIQVLDVANWLAEPDDGVRVQRWNPNSLIEPLQEGNTYFARLVDDLKPSDVAKPKPVAVEMAGWAFVKGSLPDDTVDWPLVPGDPSTTLLNLINDLRNSGVNVRMLVNKFVQFDQPTFDDLPELVPIIFTLYASLSPQQTLGKIQTDPAGYVVGLIAVAVLSTILTTTVTLDLVKKIFEFSQPMKDALDAIDSTIATWTPYPAAFADNPLVAPPPVAILGHTIDDLSHFGVYHQKYVVVQRSDDTPPPDDTYVGYLGGIDINSDRVDTTLHRAKHPFHDVQVRLTGPAVADLIRSYEERASVYSGAQVPIPIPDPGSIPATGNHLVQIARTYFKPLAGSGTTAFSFAPNGETTPVRTLKSAFAQARDFIYIEDQYFTPPDDYVQALIDAADSSRGVRALFITLPFATDQPYGQVRRADVLAALQTAWGGRFFAGTPLRRYLHETPALTTNLGRMYLSSTLSQADGTATFGAYAHLPSPPFWAFIGNELVLVHALAGPPSGSGATATQQVEIVRASGGSGGWGAQPVQHPIWTPVLSVQLPSIYVHAKVTVVDDIFLFAGSSNMNRRGLYHDGEINSFTIPQHLRSDPTNPARILRSRLMAEHLGLTPEMGQALFADPISAIPYFTSRTWYEGSRRQPLSFYGSMPPDVPIGTAGSISVFLLHVLLGTLLDAAKPDVWPLLSDPTGANDPTPWKNGPDYP
jgi:phosphatidylserine/phosphatidylglycerophosphate/cardiolipin synthase-like enzyme